MGSTYERLLHLAAFFAQSNRFFVLGRHLHSQRGHHLSHGGVELILVPIDGSGETIRCLLAQLHQIVEGALRQLLQHRFYSGGRSAWNSPPLLQELRDPALIDPGEWCIHHDVVAIGRMDELPSADGPAPCAPAHRLDPVTQAATIFLAVQVAVHGRLTDCRLLCQPRSTDGAPVAAFWVLVAELLHSDQQPKTCGSHDRGPASQGVEADGKDSIWSHDGVIGIEPFPLQPVQSLSPLRAVQLVLLHRLCLPLALAFFEAGCRTRCSSTGSTASHPGPETPSGSGEECVADSSSID